MPPADGCYGCCVRKWDRMCLIVKARWMRGAARAMTRTAARGEARTPEEAKQRSMEAAPLYLCLASRAERGEELPEVEVGCQATEEGEEEMERLVVSVVKHVIEELADDVIDELRGMIGLRVVR